MCRDVHDLNAAQDKRRIAAGLQSARLGNPSPQSDPFVKGLTAVGESLKQSIKATQSLIDHLKG